MLVVVASACLICFAHSENRAAEIAGWGTVINPDGDCTIREAAGKVAIEIPSTKHDMWYGGKNEKTRFNAPRVLREVKGNFVATVRVTADWETGLSEGGYNGAGLLVWDSERQYLRMERNRFANPAAGTHQLTYTTPLYDLDNKRRFYNSTRDEFFEGRSTWLRIERFGGTFITSISRDGKWKRTGVVATDFRNTVLLGIHAVSSTPSAFNIEYEQFEVKSR